MDTLGGATVLLTDKDATRDRVAAEFAALENCDPDDTVVIAFSGHGSETHELVVHDTEYYNVAATAIPLDDVQDWFSRIPAKRLIFILDCCFGTRSSAHECLGTDSDRSRQRAPERPSVQPPSFFKRSDADPRRWRRAVTHQDARLDLEARAKKLLDRAA